MVAKVVIIDYIVNLEVVQLFKFGIAKMKKIEKLKEEVEKLKDDRLDRLSEDLAAIRKLIIIHEKLILSNHKFIEEIDNKIKILEGNKEVCDKTHKDNEKNIYC